jgi:hypothetical protein
VQLWSICNRPLNGCLLVSLRAFLKCVSYAKRNTGIISMMNWKECENKGLWLILRNYPCTFLKTLSIACVQQMSEPWISQIWRRGTEHYMEKFSNQYYCLACCPHVVLYVWMQQHGLLTAQHFGGVEDNKMNQSIMIWNSLTGIYVLLHNFFFDSFKRKT